MDFNAIPSDVQRRKRKLFLIIGGVLAFIAICLMIVFFTRSSSTPLHRNVIRSRDQAGLHGKYKDLIEILSKLPESQFESAPKVFNSLTPDQWEQLSKVPQKDLDYAPKSLKTAYSFTPVVKAHLVLNSSKPMLLKDDVDLMIKSIKEKEAELKKFPGNDAKIKAFKMAHPKEFETIDRSEHSSSEDDSGEEPPPQVEPSEAIRKAKALLDLLKSGSKRLYKDLTNSEVDLLIALDSKLLDTEEIKQLVLSLQNDHKLITKFRKILLNKKLPLLLKDMEIINNALGKEEDLGLNSEEVTKAELMERMNELMEKASTMDESALIRTYKTLIDEVLEDNFEAVTPITKPAELQQLKSKVTPNAAAAQVRDVLQRNNENNVLSIADSNVLNGLDNRTMERIGLIDLERTKIARLKQNTSTYQALLTFVRQSAIADRTLYKLMSVSTNTQAKAILEGINPSFDMQIFPNDNTEREQISKLKEYLPVYRSLQALGDATVTTSDINTKVTLPSTVPMEKLTEAIANFGYGAVYQQKLRDLKVRVENASRLQQFLNEPANRTVDVISNSTNIAFYELLNDLKDPQFDELFQGSAALVDIGILRDKVKARHNVLKVITGKIGTDLLTNSDYALLAPNEALLDHLALSPSDLIKSKELIKNNREHRALLDFARKPIDDRTLCKLLTNGDARMRLESVTLSDLSSLQIDNPELGIIISLKKKLSIHQILEGLGDNLDTKVTLPDNLSLAQLTDAADNSGIGYPLETRVRDYRARILKGIDLKNLFTPSSSGALPSLDIIVRRLPLYDFFWKLSPTQFDELFPNTLPSRAAIVELRNKANARHNVVGVIAGRNDTDLLTDDDYTVLTTNEALLDHLVLNFPDPSNLNKSKQLLKNNKEHRALLIFASKPDADRTLGKLLTSGDALRRLEHSTPTDIALWQINAQERARIEKLKEWLTVHQILIDLGDNLDSKVTLPAGIAMDQLNYAADYFNYEDLSFLRLVKRYRDRVLDGILLKNLLTPSSGVLPAFDTFVRSHSHLYEFFWQLSPTQFDELFPYSSTSRAAIEALLDKVKLRGKICVLLIVNILTTRLSDDNFNKLISNDLAGLALNDEQMEKCHQLIEYNEGHRELLAFVLKPRLEDRTLYKLMYEPDNAKAWKHLKNLTPENLNDYYDLGQRQMIEVLKSHLLIHQTLDALDDRIDDMVTIPPGISSIDDLHLATNLFGYPSTYSKRLMQLSERIRKASELKLFLKDQTNRNINVITSHRPQYTFLKDLKDVHIQDIFEDDEMISDVKELRDDIQSRESVLHAFEKPPNTLTDEEKAILSKNKDKLVNWNVPQCSYMNYEYQSTQFVSSLNQFHLRSDYDEAFTRMVSYYNWAKTLSPPDKAGEFHDDVHTVVLRYLNNKINRDVDDRSFEQWYPCLHYVSGIKPPENEPPDVKDIRNTFVNDKEEAYAILYCKEVTSKVAKQVREVVNRYKRGFLPSVTSWGEDLNNLRLVQGNPQCRPTLCKEVAEPIRAIDPATSREFYKEKEMAFWDNPDMISYQLLESLHLYNLFSLGTQGTFLDFEYDKLSKRYKDFDLKDFCRYGRALVFLERMKNKDCKLTFEDLARSKYWEIRDKIESQLSPTGTDPINEAELAFYSTQLTYLNDIPNIQYVDDLSEALPKYVPAINSICKLFIEETHQQVLRGLAALRNSFFESGKFDENIRIRIENLIAKAKYHLAHSTIRSRKDSLRSLLDHAHTTESLLSYFIETRYYDEFLLAMSLEDNDRCNAFLLVVNEKQQKFPAESGLKFSNEYTEVVEKKSINQIKRAYWPILKRRMCNELWDLLADNSDRSSQIECIKTMVYALRNYDSDRGVDDDATLGFKFSNNLDNMIIGLGRFLAEKAIFENFIDKFVGDGDTIVYLPPADFKSMYSESRNVVFALLGLVNKPIDIDGISIPLHCSPLQFAKLILEKIFIQHLWEDASFQPVMKELLPKLTLLNAPLWSVVLVKEHILAGLFDRFFREPLGTISHANKVVETFKRVKNVILSHDDPDNKLSMLSLALKYADNIRSWTSIFSSALKLDEDALFECVDSKDNQLIVGWLVALASRDRSYTKKFELIFHIQSISAGLNLDVYNSFLEKLQQSQLKRQELGELGLLLINLAKIDGHDKAERQDQCTKKVAFEICQNYDPSNLSNLIDVVNFIRRLIIQLPYSPITIGYIKKKVPRNCNIVKMICFKDGDNNKPEISTDAMINTHSRFPVGILYESIPTGYTNYYFRYFKRNDDGFDQEIGKSGIKEFGTSE